MSIPATIRAMRHAGMSAEQILDCVLAIEEERLAKARLRTANSRKNNNNRDVTPITLITKKESPPDPLKKNNPPSPPTGDIPPKRGPTLCPSDWQPAEKTISNLKAEGFTAGQIETARLEMIDWSQSGGKRKHDWDATLRNWVRRNAKPPARASPQDRTTRLQAGIAESRKDLGP